LFTLDATSTTDKGFIHVGNLPDAFDKPPDGLPFVKYVV
jgi:hypothetical protein